MRMISGCLAMTFLLIVLIVDCYEIRRNDDFSTWLLCSGSIGIKLTIIKSHTKTAKHENHSSCYL